MDMSIYDKYETEMYNEYMKDSKTVEDYLMLPMYTRTCDQRIID
jgi:hypothetical protein